MISFEPTEEQEVAREAMRDFATEVMRPLARECDEASSVSQDFLDQAWQLGLTSTQIPEEYGGGGEESSPVLNTIVLEELACGDATLALAALCPSLFTNPIVDQGTDEQKKKYLPSFCGQHFQCASLALIEPTPTFDPFSLTTVAERRGDRYVLSGEKRLVPMGDKASHFLVLAAGDTGNGSQGSVDAFIVPRQVSGLEVSEPERNLGLRALGSSTISLKQVEVPLEDRLGGENGIDAQRLVDLCRTALATVMVGLSRAVLEYSIPYAKDRVAFGEAIARKQAIAFMLSDMRIETDASRWLVWKAASHLEKGLDAARSAYQARSYAAEQCMKIADNGVQVLGGHGYIREHPVEMWYRNARTLGVLEGTVAI